MLKAILIPAGIALCLLAGFTLVPSPIDAASWQPPTPPAMEGPYDTNNRLKQSKLLAVGKVYGPEDIDVDKDGLVYGGTQDGKIIRVHPNGRVEDWIETGGRPLGLHFDAAGNLVVCDAYKGLLSISPQGEVSTLATEADGGPFLFTDDLDISTDGKIYFTDASSKWKQSEYMLDLMEARPWGRLLVHDPATGKTTVLMKDMYFPNGVALSQNEDFVLVNETWRYRIIRYWLKGQKAGTSDIFIENLPGFPDGISSNRQGTFWLAMPTPRNPKVDKLHPLPALKEFAVKLPQWMQPKPVEYGFVLGFDEQGKITHNLQDTDGRHLKEITSVQQHGDSLYFGTLHNDRIGRLKL